MEVVFGTSNPAKVDDIRKLIHNPDITLKTLADINVAAPDIEENGKTFEENALIKYDSLRPLIPEQMLLVTEDSGIEIDSLNGEPGVYARRWNPESRELSDEEIVEKTLRLMKDKKDRTARFVSAFALGDTSIKRQTLRGELVGEILTEPDSKGMIAGFPYRALFYIPQLGKMLYEVHDIPLQQRNNVATHREKAWMKLEEIINEHSHNT